VNCGSAASMTRLCWLTAFQRFGGQTRGERSTLARCPLCPDSDQVLHRSEMSRFANRRHLAPSKTMADARRRRPPILRERLLSLMAFEFFLDFPFYRGKVESRRCLHRRIIDSRFRQFSYLLLNQHKAPELATHEVVHVTSSHVIHALTTD
jgi:hypothetical protein